MKEIQPYINSRILNAPRELVFRVYSEAAHLENWLSPEGFHTIYSKIEFKVDGM